LHHVREEILEARSELEPMSEEVQAKAQAAEAWCSAMNKATGKAWKYRLIPHDSISPTQSFLGVISNAVALTE
jgi:hypothetical protein